MQNPLAMSAGVILMLTMLLAFVVALALVFDPRYRDFPFAPLTAAGACRFSCTALRSRGRKERVRQRRRSGPACSRFRCFTSCSMKVLPIGSRCGCARRWLRFLSVWLGCATCQAKDQQPDRQRRQTYIIEHNSTARRGKSEAKKHKRGSQQVERGNDQRDPSEN